MLNVDSGIDYRLRVLSQSELYFEKGREDSQKRGEPFASDRALPLHKLFSDLSGGRQPEAEVLVINRRNLQALGVSEGVLLAEFAELVCLVQPLITRSLKKYSVLIDNVPELTTDIEDGARRFIALIDEFYDRNISRYRGDRPMTSFIRARSSALSFNARSLD